MIGAVSVSIRLSLSASLRRLNGNTAPVAVVLPLGGDSDRFRPRFWPITSLSPDFLIFPDLDPEPLPEGAGLSGGSLIVSS